jgi:uncharacterized protein (DUF2252 family)
MPLRNAGQGQAEVFMSPTPAEGTVLDAILQFNRRRRRKLVRFKLRRMLGDPFTFFRGTNHLFAGAWSELRPPEAGPDLLICGDLHLENFGAFRTAEGDFRYDINDFDDAAVAPCSLDLVRCATSIFLAAEQWRLTPTSATGMALTFLEHYRQAVIEATATGTVGEVTLTSGQGPIWELLGSTAVATQATLLVRNTKPRSDGTPIIRRTKKHPEVSRKRFEAIRGAVEEYGQSVGAPAAFRIHDVTGRIVGVGSLGVRRYLALIEGDGPPDGYRLIDIKQAEPSPILGCTTASQPDWGGDEARRVVRAQTALQGHPSAGLDVLHVGPRSYRIREMIPEDNRSSLDRFRKQPAKLRQAVETAGTLTAWSHLRGGRKAPDPAHDHWPELARWAAGAAIDAVLTAAARYADRTNRDYVAFRGAVRGSGGLARCLQSINQ